MAKVEITNLSDDLDETVTDGVETVTFFDPETGTKFELELGEKNAKALTKAIAGLEKYLAVARKVEAPKPAKAVKATGNQAKVREWAQANGFKVGDRGRIKAEIVEAYNLAQAAVAGTAAPEPDIFDLDLIDSRVDEAEASTAAFDAQVASEEPEAVTVEVATPVVPQLRKDSVPVSDGFDAKPFDPSDADILAMMAEIEAERGEVKFEDLLDKAAEDN